MTSHKVQIAKTKKQIAKSKVQTTKTKGQIAMIDLISAVIVFLVVFGIIFSTWVENTNSFQKKTEFHDMQEKGFYVLDYLIKNPGTKNWENISDLNGVSLIGLAKQDRIIDSSKILAFSNLATDLNAYTKSKELLLLGNYDYYFELVNGGITAGLAAPNNSSEIVLSRVVVYQGAEDIAKLTVWKWEVD